MSKLMFYERPVALSRARHRTLKLDPVPGHYRFAARTNAVPIMSTEFAEAARDHPIVFVGDADGPLNVAALVGVRDQENLFVDADGRWTQGAYVPAFARRYPFVLARTDSSDRLTVCVDEAYPGLSRERGEPLFDSAGKETPLLERVLAFLRDFHAEAERTAAFTARLRELGLLVPKVIHVERADLPARSMRGLWVVDTARLHGLDDARVIELFRHRHLAWIEAHLLSLGNLTRLVARLGERDLPAGRAADASGAPPAPPAPSS